MSSCTSEVPTLSADSHAILLSDVGWHCRSTKWQPTLSKSWVDSVVVETWCVYRYKNVLNCLQKAVSEGKWGCCLWLIWHTRWATWDNRKTPSSLFITSRPSCRILMASLIHHVVRSDSRSITEDDLNLSHKCTCVLLLNYLLFCVYQFSITSTSSSVCSICWVERFRSSSANQSELN